jgi:hypothetical protein
MIPNTRLPTLSVAPMMDRGDKVSSGLKINELALDRSLL